jgi:hypothetical protein
MEMTGMLDVTMERMVEMLAQQMMEAMEEWLI